MATDDHKSQHVMMYNKLRSILNRKGESLGLLFGVHVHQVSSDAHTYAASSASSVFTDL